MKEAKLEILLKEYELINQKIEQFISTQFSTLNVLLVILGGFIVFAINDKSNRQNYLYALPILILMLLMMVGYHYQRVMGLQGYKKYLETQINSFVGEDIVFYGHLGMHFMGNSNPFSLGNVIIYILIYIISIIFTSKMISNFNNWAYLFYGILAAVYLFMAYPIIRYTNKVYNISTEINSTSTQTESIDELIKRLDEKK